MPRGSPRRTRSRAKTSDKATLSVPSDLYSPTTMPAKFDSVELMSMITACLTKDELVDKLVSKLTDKLKDAVVSALADSLREAREEIKGLEGRVKSLEAKLVTMETNVNQRSDDLEQYTRRNNIRIFGVPEEIGEDTDEKVLALFREKMNVDIPIVRLDRSHRVGPKLKAAEDGTPRWRPIIVRFVRYRDRQLVFNGKKALKGTRITIREDLTSQRVSLYSAAVKKFGLRNTWTLDGRVLWMDGGRKGVATCVSDLPT